jgi:hypothetical protein
VPEALTGCRRHGAKNALDEPAGSVLSANLGPVDSAVVKTIGNEQSRYVVSDDRQADLRDKEVFTERASR